MLQLIKIVILGPESTGKSTLANQLAQHYRTNYVPEYARQYIDSLDRHYEKSDLLAIAKVQLQLEDEKIQSAKRFLFCDTNLIVIKIWSDYKYGHTNPWILKSLELRAYDLYLLMDTDLPWEPDNQRENPTQRRELFDLYRNYLDSNDCPYVVIGGKGDKRLQRAIESVESLSTTNG